MTIQITVDELAESVYQNSIDHGFYPDGPGFGSRNFGEMIALMHSELSEALEEHRAGRQLVYIKDGKPEGIAIELVDCAIRIFDTLASMLVMEADPDGGDLSYQNIEGYSISELFLLKADYNANRQMKHGKAY